MAGEESSNTVVPTPIKEQGAVEDALKNLAQNERHSSAVKECPFCAETIKAKAKKCRFCGELLSEEQPQSIQTEGRPPGGGKPASHRKTTRTLTTEWIVFAVGTVLALWYVKSHSYSASSPPVERAKEHASRADEEMYGTKVMAWVMAQDFVKGRLVSPSSADFGGFFNGQSYEDCVTHLGNGRYVVSGWVDSQNSFGATLRSDFTCTLNYVGNDKWQCESIRVVGH